MKRESDPEAFRKIISTQKIKSFFDNCNRHVKNVQKQQHKKSGTPARHAAHIIYIQDLYIQAPGLYVLSFYLHLSEMGFLKLRIHEVTGYDERFISGGGHFKHRIDHHGLRANRTESAGSELILDRLYPRQRREPNPRIPVPPPSVSNNFLY